MSAPVSRSSRPAPPARTAAPAARPRETRATPAARTRDELSNGRGSALRRAASIKLSATLPSVGPPPPVQRLIDTVKGIGRTITENVQWAIANKNGAVLAAEIAARGGLIMAGNLLGAQSLAGAAVEYLINRAMKTPPPNAPFPPPNTLPTAKNPADRDYVPTTGPLWGSGGPDPKVDVNQGNLGDCYLMASIASLSATEAQKLIQDNHDGTFTVRLYDTDATGKITPVFVRVDGALPTADAARYTDSQKWVALVEKAAAIHGGSYEALAGDLKADYFATPTMLTGRQTVAYWAPAAGADVLYARMASATADGRALFVGGVSPQTPGTVGGHAYTVVSVRTDPNGQQFVTLRNPWGPGDDPRTEPGDNPHEDGVFEMPIEQFMKDFPFLAVAGG